MANPIHRNDIETKDKRSQRKVADSTTKLDKTASQPKPILTPHPREEGLDFDSRARAETSAVGLCAAPTY